MSDFRKAHEKIELGTERKSEVLPLKVKKNTSIHEAGHALLSTLYPDAKPVSKATVIPRGQALGLVSHIPTEELSYQITKKQLYAEYLYIIYIVL